MAEPDLIPPAGTPERAALVRRVAEQLWKGREQERAFAEAGDYWQATFEKLASDAVDAIEAIMTSIKSNRL